MKTSETITKIVVKPKGKNRKRKRKLNSFTNILLSKNEKKKNKVNSYD